MNDVFLAVATFAHGRWGLCARGQAELLITCTRASRDRICRSPTANQCASSGACDR